jgi:hypothetical protein
VKVVKISRANNIPSAQEMVALIDSIRLSAKSREVDKDVAKMIENLPSSQPVLNDMDETQLGLLYETVGHIWRKLSGQKISDVSIEHHPTDMDKLDGNYWFLPGGMMLHGFNHFSIAKSHRDLICRLLDINPFVFEHKLGSQDHNDLIWLVLSCGGVRVMVERGESKIFMQTTEKSWPWVRDKLKKMYHKKRIVKVLDSETPYEGWSSGITVLVKSQPDWVPQ